MAYVPSHLEICPFWVNKTSNLKTYCVVPPPPGATDDFTYTVFDGFTAINFYIESDNSIKIGTDNPIGLASMQNEGVPVLTCDQSVYNLDLGRVHRISNQDYVRYPAPSIQGMGARFFSIFTTASCIASESALAVDDTFEIALSFIGFFNEIKEPTVDINNSCIVCMCYTGSQSIGIVQTTDGINWNNAYEYSTLTLDCSEPAFILPNLKPTEGGFSIISDSTITSLGCRCRVSDSNGLNWVDKGPAIHDNNYVYMCYGEKVIFFIFTGANHIYVANGYGTTVGHTMLPPDYWGVDVLWDTISISGIFTIDPDTETIFTLFKLGGETHYSLFSSPDWGLTWNFISSLLPIDYPTHYFGVKIAHETAGFGTYYMQVKNGYLTLLDVTFNAMYQFKLSDII